MSVQRLFASTLFASLAVSAFAQVKPPGAATPPPIPGTVPPAAAAAPAQSGELPKDPQTPDELTEHPVTRYEGLWAKSPFMFKVVAPATQEAVNPLADWSFAGYTLFPDRTSVTLINAKDPTQFRTVFSVPHYDKQRNPDEWTLVEFQRPTNNSLKDVEVKIRTKDGQTYPVKADEKVLARKVQGNTAKAAPQKGMQPQVPIPGQPAINPTPPVPGVNPPDPNSGRRRVVLPPPILPNNTAPQVPTTPAAPVPPTQ